MVIILAGIAAGIVVISATLGGLAAEGAFDSATTQNNDEKKGGTEQQEKADPNLLKGKIAIYNTFSKYAEGEIKNKKINIESTTGNDIDKEMDNLQKKLNDEFYKLHLNKILKEIGKAKTLTSEKVKSIQSKLSKYTAHFKGETFMRWHIYHIFSKIAPDDYSAKTEDQFKIQYSDEQYKELDNVKTIIPSSLAVKALNQAIETTKNIEKATILNSEQQMLISDAILLKTKDIFVKIITKEINPQLYSLFIDKGLTTGMVDLAAFKKLKREEQVIKFFKAQGKIKDIPTRGELGNILDSSSEAGIQDLGLKAAEEAVEKEITSGALKIFLQRTEELVNWLKNYRATS